MFASLEIVLQEQSYSGLHSGQSLAWDPFYSDITIPAAIGGRVVTDVAIGECRRWCRSLCNSLNIVKHCETLVKHRGTLVKHCETHLKHCEPLVKHYETQIKHHETLKHELFDATILSSMRRFWRTMRPALGAEFQVISEIAELV